QTRAAANLFDVYLEKLKEAGRYDFTDMILWVLRAFKEAPAILQQYQERFQFILVDEFQDTNGAQSELLYELTKFWDDPNLFVVGDDDQSIYEFQGARVKNIIEFYERFEEHIKVIVLTDNYRSSQAILDMATSSINNNQQRLLKQVPSLKLNKDIVAKNPRFADGKDNIRPRIKQYPNLLHEQADIVMQIEVLRAAGMPLQDVAVLYAQHKQADFLMVLLERKGIPYSVKRPVDVLSVPLIKNLLLVLQYLQEERQKSFSGEGILFEILHAPYYGIAPTDIAKLSLYMSTLRGENKTYWRLVLAQPLLLESLNLDTVSAIHRIGKCLDEWLMTMSNLTLPLLLEKMVYESGIIEFLLHGKEPAWEIQVLHTFFHFVHENHERTPKLNLQSFLDMIEKMQDEKISLPLEKVIQQDNGLRLFTAHGAKGTEFEHVFILGANSDFWEKKRARTDIFKLPPMEMNFKDEEEKSSSEEVTRRLFYVALTRAKKALLISYSTTNEKGAERTASSFIDEIAQPEEHILTKPSEEEMVSSLSWAMSPVPEVQIELADKTIIARTLQNFNMSYSSLSKYLRCPLAFYYENILRVPMLKGEALAFGSAIHNALERLFKEMKLRQQEFPSKEELIKFFEQNFYFEGDGLPNPAYERRLEQGRTVLSDYYDTFKNTWSKNVEIELSVKRFYLDGVPVVGKIDKIEIEENGVRVIDYKTGNPDNNAAKNIAQPNVKEPNGGDYWRQMVFYKLLLENSNELHWKVKMGTFEYVERSKTTGEYKSFNVPVFEQDELAVRQQLRNTYANIMNQEFKKGCGKDDCQWCNFARRYELIRQDAADFVEIDDL
ncbi:MAG: ATP-dependent DNA helicase, partial [Chitinophagaceae bacterium]